MSDDADVFPDLTDFDNLGWHYVELHAIAFEPVLGNPGVILLDVDYITRWHTEERPWSFDVAPATVVFNPAQDLVLTADMRRTAFEPSIMSLSRQPRPDEWYDWTVEGDCFEMTFSAPRISLRLRGPSMHSERARLPSSTRPPFDWVRDGGG
jgi:hypothetical protein